MAVKKKSPEEASFEEALAQLETLVTSMENGDIALGELVAQYEQGSHYLRTCQKRLREAELKIEKLREHTDSLTTEPFEPGAQEG